MGFSNTSMFLKIAFILLIIALIIQILGVALPYWVTIDTHGFKGNYGLFRGCTETHGKKHCFDYKPKDLEAWQEATQAMEMIGLLLIMAALICTVLAIFILTELRILKMAAFIASFCAFMFIFIGVCVYAGEKSDVLDLSGAFAITIIAFIICLVAGILGVVDWIGIGGA